jgi:glycosyltransferase involved in cell wall biosynthesis
VSVVIPTRDRLELLRLAVASVLAQTESNLELVIVDDASADSTARYLGDLADGDPRVVLVRNINPKGGAGARNEGIAVSRGQWIAFLDDDDEWAPAKLERQLEAMHAHPSAVACILRRSSGRERLQSVPREVTLRQLLAGNRIGGASMCLSRAPVLREVGGFDEAFASGQDLDLWVRLRGRGPIIGCPEPLVTHRYHAGARITTNMRAQYLGARRFYFKHRHLMDAALRRERIALSCYLMSRQPTRSLRYRSRYLGICIRNSHAPLAFSYALSSGVRLVNDALRRGRGSRPGGGMRTGEAAIK